MSQVNAQVGQNLRIPSPPQTGVAQQIAQHGGASRVPQQLVANGAHGNTGVGSTIQQGLEKTAGIIQQGKDKAEYKKERRDQKEYAQRLAAHQEAVSAWTQRRNTQMSSLIVKMNTGPGSQPIRDWMKDISDEVSSVAGQRIPTNMDIYDLTPGTRQYEIMKRIAGQRENSARGAAISLASRWNNLKDPLMRKEAERKLAETNVVVQRLNESGAAELNALLKAGGYTGVELKTFDDVRNAKPSALTSGFKVAHNVIDRVVDRTARELSDSNIIPERLASTIIDEIVPGGAEDSPIGRQLHAALQVSLTGGTDVKDAGPITSKKALKFSPAQAMSISLSAQSYSDYIEQIQKTLREDYKDLPAHKLEALDTVLTNARVNLLNTAIYAEMGGASDYEFQSAFSEQYDKAMRKGISASDELGIAEEALRGASEAYDTRVVNKDYSTGYEEVINALADKTNDSVWMLFNDGVGPVYNPSLKPIIDERRASIQRILAAQEAQQSEEVKTKGTIQQALSSSMPLTTKLMGGDTRDPEQKKQDAKIDPWDDPSYMGGGSTPY